MLTCLNKCSSQTHVLFSLQQPTTIALKNLTKFSFCSIPTLGSQKCVTNIYLFFSGGFLVNSSENFDHSFNNHSPWSHSRLSFTGSPGKKHRCLWQIVSTKNLPVSVVPWTKLKLEVCIPELVLNETRRDWRPIPELF